METSKARTPLRVLRNVIERVREARVVDSMRRKPGYYIEQLKTEDREILKSLKSDDIKNAGEPNYK